MTAGISGILLNRCQSVSNAAGQFEIELTGHDTKPVASVAMVGYNVDLKRQKLEFEMRKYDEEMEEHKKRYEEKKRYDEEKKKNEGNV